MPRASRAARTGPLTAQQAAPRNLWEGLRGRQARGWGLCWRQACAKCRLPGQQENIRCRARWGLNLECGWGLRSWFPGGSCQQVPWDTREGTAEALSSQRAMVAGFWMWTGPSKHKGAMEQGPARAWLSRRSWSEQGHRTRGPLGTSILACKGAATCPRRGARWVPAGPSLPQPPCLSGPPASRAHVSCPLVVQGRIFTVVPRALGGQEGPIMGERTTE